MRNGFERDLQINGVVQDIAGFTEEVRRHSAPGGGNSTGRASGEGLGYGMAMGPTGPRCRARRASMSGATD